MKFLEWYSVLYNISSVKLHQIMQKYKLLQSPPYMAVTYYFELNCNLYEFFPKEYMNKHYTHNVVYDIFHGEIDVYEISDGYYLEYYVYGNFCYLVCAIDKK